MIIVKEISQIRELKPCDTDRFCLWKENYDKWLVVSTESLVGCKSLKFQNSLCGLCKDKKIFIHQCKFSKITIMYRMKYEINLFTHAKLKASV